MNFKYILFLNKVGSDSKTNLEVFLSFRNCRIGERYIENFICQECPLNTYSFIRNFNDRITDLCKDCSKESFNCFGGSKLTPRKGFWRLNEKSTNFLECPNPTACLGDTRKFIDSKYSVQYSTGICADGYKDVKCTVCDKNWGISSKYSCISCDNLYYFQAVFKMLIKILFSLYSVFAAINMSKTITNENKSINFDEVISSNCIKVFNNHIQILTLMVTLPFKFPVKLSYDLNFFLSIAPSDPGSAFSLECLLRKYNWSL